MVIATRLSAAAALLVPMLLACGGEAAGDGDGGDDATADAPLADGGRGDGGDSGADAPADAGDESATAISLHLKCAEGDQCEGGVCCATLAFGGDCVLDEISPACTPSSGCPTTLQPFCGGDETVQLCDSNADCTEPGYDRCCTFQITGHASSLTLCASQQMVQSADASCP